MERSGLGIRQVRGAAMICAPMAEMIYASFLGFAVTFGDLRGKPLLPSRWPCEFVDHGSSEISCRILSFK
jgi:hypothetical protein